MGNGYNDKVMDHFENPRNVGVIEEADGEGYETNPICGDTMRLYIKVQSDVIVDAKFKTLGCAAAIATSSAGSELIKDKTVDEALSYTREDFAAAVGGLPPVKMHCSVLVADALKKAVSDYRSKQKKLTEV